MSRPTLFAAVLIAVASGQARADTFTVTSTASVGPGTLYQAIDDSNQIPGPHSIAFDLPVDSVIAMQHQPVPVISSVLSIDGANVPGLVLDGADVVRLFHVAGPNSEFTLANIEVRRGRGSRRGGCLFVQAPTKTTAGKVTLDRVVMRGCQAVRNASNETVSGGAIYLEGRDMSVINSQFLDNETYSVDPGLATVATGGAIAVVIESQHTVLIQDSQFIANRVTGSSASGSGCCRAKGAVIDASGSGLIVVEGSRIIANQGRTLDFSTDMGGIIKSTMSTSLKNNLFFDNDSIGTMINLEMGWSPGSFVRIHNNTLVANRTEFGTSIFLYAVADASLINNTFLSWISPGHPLPHLRVAGHGTTPNALILGHNLFGPADSRWPDPARPLCQIHEGVDVEHHHNQIYGAANDCGPTLDPDAADLRIEALRDNGGLVETVSVLQGSPILDAGNPLPPLANDPTRCQTNDARYFPRPRDGDGDGEAICDVGAWESQREAPLFRDDFQPVLWRPEPAAAAF